MERCLFVIVDFICITSVNIPIFKGIEMCVGSVFCFQFLVCLVMFLIVFYEPELGVLAFVENGFER